MLFFLILSPLGVSAAPAEYTLGAGDQIEIQVHQEADLSMTLRIGESGVFSYPYLGSLRASGQTTSELEDLITNGLLKDILVHPSVSVRISAYRHFYISGEVAHPGSYPYQPGLTLLQAITIAGGPTEWASSSKFQILKEDATEPVSANKKTFVRPGDTVTILEGLF
jgi:polysaccharide export outer membrane protein